jgi:hypothetical protein
MYDDEILVGLDEIRVFMRRGRRTVLKMLQNGEIPAKMVHGAYMTTKSRIIAWLNDQPVDKVTNNHVKELKR